MKKLLIITGPQGSGNHLWSKILAMHPAVVGWVMGDYWEGHHQEPFNEFWHDPTKFETTEFSDKNYVTSISTPYYRDKELHWPDYKKFIEYASKIFDVKTCIIGRDINIIRNQQKRVRGDITLNLDDFKSIEDPFFISSELLFLYGQEYLKFLGKQLDFPIAWNHATRLIDILKNDANKKYIKEVEDQELDDTVRQVSLIDS